MKRLKERLGSLKNRVTKERNGGSSVVTSRASLGAPHIDSSGSSTSEPTELHVPPSEEPSKTAVASPPETTLNVSSALVTSTYRGSEGCQLRISHKDQRNPKHSVSQRLWNAAYDDLEKNEDTADLVKSYVDILNKALSAETSNTSNLESNFVELGNPTDRQEHMRKLVEEGQKRVATTSKITDGLQNVVGYIEKIKGVIDVAIGNIPQAALPWAGVSIGLQILSNPGRAIKSNLQGIVYVVSRMDWYCALSESLLDEDKLVKSFEPILKELNEAITVLYKALLLYQIKSVCYYHQHRGLTVLRGLANWDDWDGDLQKVKEAEHDVIEMSTLYHKEHEKKRLDQLYESAICVEKSLGDIHQDLQALFNQQKNMWTDSKNERCLKDLFVVDPRINMKTIMQNKEELLADVYSWVLHSDEYARFVYWGDEAPSFPECRLLWITGSAGTGKTMLIMGIINELQRQFSYLTPRLSFFFCQATKNNLHNATNALRSLIWLLLFQQPRLIKHIQPDYDQMGRALFDNEDAFNALDSILEKMLEDPCLKPVYFIIDALDECDNGLALLLRLISKTFTLSDKVKWLVSSRPEVLTQLDIQQEVHQLEDPLVSRVLIELNRERLRDPVNIYIEHKLSALKSLRGYSEEVLVNISTEVRHRANNIFLWVALVFKELSHMMEWDAVEAIQNMPQGLSGLYNRIMDKIEKSRGAWRCKNLLMAVSLAFRPLSFSELTVVADLPSRDGASRAIAEQCGSFLIITAEGVSLIHQSAKDYLDENQIKLRSGGVVKGHMDICERSIDAMSKALKKNIYAKGLDFMPSGMEIPNPDPLAHLRYACLFWVDHLSFSSPDVNHYNQIHSFFKRHFLHWLEALNLIGHPYQCFRMLNKLNIDPSTHSELYSLIHDAKRFILKNASIVESAPIQLYSSAILFSPQASKIRNLFQHEVSGIKVLSGLDSDWGRNLQTFNSNCRNAIFSPNGKSLVVSSKEPFMLAPFVQIRNAMTGQIEHTFEGHSTAAFSHDGSLLASSSRDMTIQIWNMTTGQTESVLQGYEGTVCTLAFSPCENFLALGLDGDGENLWLWDVAIGKTRHRFKGPPAVRIVFFSSSGEKLVAGSEDGTTWMWDVPFGENQCTHKGYFDKSRPCLAISPDESKLASQADYKTIQVWDLSTWEIKHLLKGSSRVTDLTFSPRNNHLISASDDHMIRVWNFLTGHAEYTLPIHGRRTNMSLSLDGSRLALHWEVGEQERTGIVHLWNTTTWEEECKLIHGPNISSMAFSPDGQRLVSATSGDDGSVCVWDISTGLTEHAFEGHSSPARVLAFSPDGSKLVSTSQDTTIIWDVTTGQAERIIPDSTRVALSPDGIMLASASGHISTVCVWDIETGLIKHTLADRKYTLADHDHSKGAYKSVKAMSFSSDGRKIAIAMIDKSIYVWDLTAKQLVVLQHRGRAILAFSPDGEGLASAGAADHSINLSNTTTGQDKGSLKGHGSWITTIVYSPDGKKLASGSLDNTIRIWEAATGQIESILKCADNFTLLFSPDGNKLACGDTVVIRVWNLATCQAEHIFSGHHASISSTVFDIDSGMGQIIESVGNQPFYSIDEAGVWVTRNGAKVLYLTPQFRPAHDRSGPELIAVSDRTLATANDAGRVTIIQFAEDIKGS
ncbi:WD40-repeat-containing domain protein [Xylaria curta]|nr:WD40-repeat-containing domain protein [Xylaria curta]